MARKNCLLIFNEASNFSARFVRFVEKMDKENLFYCIKADSAMAKVILSRNNVDPLSLRSIVLVSDNIIYTRAEAMIKGCKELGALWRPALILRVLPKPTRNYVYDYMARVIR